MVTLPVQIVTEASLPVPGLHLPEGEGQGGEEPQTREHSSHQVVSQPGVVKVTQVAPETN